MSVTQTQIPQSRPSKTLKEEIEKAIRMLNDMLHDVTVDKVVQIASVISMLKRVADQLEMISGYMILTIDEMMKENDVRRIYFLIESLKKTIWYLAKPDYDLLLQVDRLWKILKNIKREEEL